MIVIIYDGLLLGGVVLVSYVPVYSTLQLLPVDVREGSSSEIVKIVFLLGVTFFFYGWFWTHGGQTLGMRAWHLYVVDSRGRFPNWITALKRYFAALCSWSLVAALCYLLGLSLWYLAIGLGFSWMLLNPARLAWHDILSGTRIVYLSQKKMSALQQEGTPKFIK